MSDRHVGRALLAAAAGVTAVLIAGPALAAPGDEQITTPPTVAGQTMATEPALTDAANQIKTDLSAKVPNATGTAGAFYVDPSDPAKLTMVVGATGKVDDPTAELDQVFAGAANSGVPVQNIQNVNPGTLSGQAKCGTGTVSNQSVVVCAWADPGSVGLMRFQGRDMAASSALFAQMRDGMLTRE